MRRIVPVKANSTPCGLAGCTSAAEYHTQDHTPELNAAFTTKYKIPTLERALENIDPAACVRKLSDRAQLRIRAITKTVFL